jgi:hypothetical protein
VFQAAEATGLHPFFICVGREEEPSRIRRAAFPYDASHPGEALPLITVEFRQASVYPQAVPDGRRSVANMRGVSGVDVSCHHYG